MIYITVAAQKGGVGKSTTAINIAAQADILRCGAPLYIVDLVSQQGNTIRHKGSIEGATWLTSPPENPEPGSFVIVDTSNHVSDMVYQSMVRSNLIVIPCTPEESAADAVKETIRTVGKAARENPELKACILLTRMDNRQYSLGFAHAVQGFSFWPVLANYIPERPDEISKAYSAKQPALIYNPRGKCAQAYKKATYEMMSLLGRQHNDDTGI